MTNDTAKDKEFYGYLLGWQSHDFDMGDVVYTIFKTDDKDLGGMLQTPVNQEEVIPPHWLSYVAVDDVEAMADKAPKLGADLKVPVRTIPNTGKFVVLMDPTGAHIALW